MPAKGNNFSNFRARFVREPLLSVSKTGAAVCSLLSTGRAGSEAALAFADCGEGSEPLPGVEPCTACPTAPCEPGLVRWRMATLLLRILFVGVGVC
jgi:hypothetical protein